MSRIAVIGAGLSGSVIAQELACAGYQVDVFEARDHVSGNIHTKRDPFTSIILHTYGAHIFHTENDRVWEYLRRFGEFVTYKHCVKATADGRVYSLPINLHTINQFYGQTYTPDQAKLFITGIGTDFGREPRTFEEQALRFVGPDLYEAFFRHYTEKQWGRSPSAIPASVLKRLPLRFDYNDSYFHGKTALPRTGYTPVVENMLDHRNIIVTLGTVCTRGIAGRYDHTFYTGPLDAWFDHVKGRLSYRTLDFVHEVGTGDRQGCPVMNYCGTEPYTRVLEHKHFAPWESHEMTVTTREYSREMTPDDEPYYPVRLVEDKAALSEYARLAEQESRVTFLGRLATYRYIDMDLAIAEALAVADKFLGRT